MRHPSKLVGGAPVYVPQYPRRRLGCGPGLAILAGTFHARPRPAGPPGRRRGERPGSLDLRSARQDFL